MRFRVLISGMVILAAIAGVSACAPPTPVRPRTTSLEVTGFASGEVGPQQITVTALDAKGRVAVGYRGTVRIDAFCSPASPCVPGGPVPLVPSQYTFTAKDRGVHSFPITIRHAPPSGQSYFVQATDTARPSLAGQQVRFIRPGSATRIDMTSYDPNPRLVVGQVLPKSKIFVSAFDQYGNYSNDPSLDFDFSTIGNPDNYQDLVDYPSTVPLTGGQATMTVPTPGMVHTPGSVITTFYLKKPGTAGANLVYGSTDVNVVSTAPNLNTSTSGGYTVQDNGALTIISDNINITLPPSTYIVSSVDTVNQTIIAVNGSTTLTMGVVTPVSPVSGDLHLSSNYPQPGDVVTISGSTNGAFNPVLVIPGQGAVSYSDGPTTRFSPLVNVTGDLN